MQLTAAIIKQTASLDSAAHRRREGLFMVEGTKAVTDTMGHFRLSMLAATPQWLAGHQGVAPEEVTVRATARDLGRMSHLTTPPPVIAVYELPGDDFDPDSLTDQLVIALDAIQDPGNLGTIIRTADWMGVRHILAGPGTADCFAPKVVQATMGSIVRVAVHYCDLPEVLAGLASKGMPVYGTVLDGDDMFDTPLPRAGVIVTGNEGRGISPEVMATLTRRLTIPSWPAGAVHGESLNAAIATAITLSAFRFPRRQP